MLKSSLLLFFFAWTVITSCSSSHEVLSQRYPETPYDVSIIFHPDEVGIEHVLGSLQGLAVPASVTPAYSRSIYDTGMAVMEIQCHSINKQQLAELERRLYGLAGRVYLNVYP